MRWKLIQSAVAGISVRLFVCINFLMLIWMLHFISRLFKEMEHTDLRSVQEEEDVTVVGRVTDWLFVPFMCIHVWVAPLYERRRVYSSRTRHRDDSYIHFTFCAASRAHERETKNISCCCCTMEQREWIFTSTAGERIYSAKKSTILMEQKCDEQQYCLLPLLQLAFLWISLFHSKLTTLLTNRATWYAWMFKKCRKCTTRAVQCSSPSSFVSRAYRWCIHAVILYRSGRHHQHQLYALHYMHDIKLGLTAQMLNSRYFT